MGLLPEVATALAATECAADFEFAAYAFAVELDNDAVVFAAVARWRRDSPAQFRH